MSGDIAQGNASLHCTKVLPLHKVTHCGLALDTNLIEFKSNILGILKKQSGRLSEYYKRRGPKKHMDTSNE